MKLSAFRIDEQSQLEVISASELSLAWLEDPIARWIDIDAASPDELRALLAPLELHPVLLENCLEPPEGQRVSSYKRALHIDFPYFTGEQPRTRAYLSMLCMPTLLITIRHGSASGSIALVEEDPLVEPSVNALVYVILRRLTLRGLPEWHDIRGGVGRLSRRIDDKPNALKFGDILDCKERVDRLTLMCEDQLDCVSSLRAAESRWSPANRLLEHFRDMVDDLRNAQTGIMRLGTQVQDLRQQYALALQDLTNKRLNFLAILSAVYLPAALVSGIFGMNFDNMPALHMHYGYFVALGAMLVLVIGQLIYFRRRGWF